MAISLEHVRQLPHGCWTFDNVAMGKSMRLRELRCWQLCRTFAFRDFILDAPLCSIWNRPTAEQCHHLLWFRVFHLYWKQVIWKFCSCNQNTFLGNNEAQLPFQITPKYQTHTYEKNLKVMTIKHHAALTQIIMSLSKILSPLLLHLDKMMQDNTHIYQSTLMWEEDLWCCEKQSMKNTFVCQSRLVSCNIIH